MFQDVIFFAKKTPAASRFYGFYLPSNDLAASEPFIFFKKSL
jgi:hypothetical protein